MEMKLTLKLDASVIGLAKRYAAKRHKSISRLVEDYFRGLSLYEANELSEIDPLVKELSGILPQSVAASPEADYADFLIEKYE